ncbi:F0F1 ATP synthase subunit delta [Candidatus Parcubacteria bacterium]|nr:F0F1 ATP synthase subunit delta [Candidatus Parcubacteria bacterium]
MKAKKLGKALFLAVQGKNEQEKQKIVKNLAEILEKKKRTYLLYQILREFEKHSRENEVVLTLSRRIEPKLLEKVKNDLRKVFGDECVFKLETDESVISGFKAKSNNYLVDASIKGLLEKLKLKSAS